MEEEIGKFDCRNKKFVKLEKNTVKGFVSPYWESILKDTNNKGTLIFFMYKLVC